MPRICHSCGSGAYESLPNNTYICNGCGYSWMEKAQADHSRYVVIRDPNDTGVQYNAPKAIYTSEKQALTVLERMCEQYNRVYYVAKLTHRATPIPSPKVKIENVD